MRDIFVLFYHPPPSCLYSRRGSERLSAHSYYTILFPSIYSQPVCMYAVCLVFLSSFFFLFFFIYIHSNASNIFCFFSPGICGRCVYPFALYTPFICLLFCTKNTREKKRKFQIPFSYTRAQRYSVLHY